MRTKEEIQDQLFMLDRAWNNANDHLSWVDDQGGVLDVIEAKIEVLSWVLTTTD